MSRRGLSVLLCLACACAVSPLGRRQLTLVSDAQLDRQAAALYQQYRKKLPVSRDASVNRYVECVARAVTAEAHEGALPPSWEVTVFVDDTPNAFALPGGKIGVHTGLLRVAETQDQLAAVLGHEVAHVLARHSNERVSAEMATRTALAATAASGAVDPGLVGLLGMGAEFGVILPYGRTHESEADLLGLDLMARAGFDPRESVRLWRNMERAAGGGPPEFLSTHPGSQTRIRDLQARIPQATALREEARARGKVPHCK
jgi:predicted Zn-dependent protease